jgi:hypothetical protein
LDPNGVVDNVDDKDEYHVVVISTPYSGVHVFEYRLRFAVLSYVLPGKYKSQYSSVI